MKNEQLTRRNSDPDNRDFRTERRHVVYRNANGHTRKVIGLVVVAAVAALAALTSSQWERFDAAATKTLENEKRIEVLATSANLRLSNIEKHVEEIRDILREER